MKHLKSALSIALAVIIITAFCSPAFSAYTKPPTVSIIVPEAVPVNETVTCTCLIYSANGFYNNLTLSENYFDFRGTGKVMLTDFQSVTYDNMTVSVTFKLTGVYPGEVRINIRPDTIYDKAGMPNGTNTVPRFIDIKLFNTEGEKAYQKMSEAEYFITVMIAPFWKLLHSIGLV